LKVGRIGNPTYHDPLVPQPIKTVISDPIQILPTVGGLLP
jgi:hypothetical protein